MTGPNPDAELDESLGVTKLPPAAVTDEHIEIARAAAMNLGVGGAPAPSIRRLAQVIADAEQRGAARALAERKAAGT